MKKNNRIAFISLIMILGTCLMSCASLGKKPYHLVILGTSDVHSNIWGYSYEDNRETEEAGLAKIWTYIKQQRKSYPNLYLIDCGDIIQGNIMTDDIYNKRPEETHPAIKAYNYMKYDAVTLGNHEFNWGTETLKNIFSKAEFPLLAANALKDGEYLTQAGSIIYNRDGVRVGIIGVTSPDIPIWDADKEGISECVFEAANVAVKREIEKIKDKVDIIVVSAHMGMFAEYDADGGSDSAQKILDDNPQIDVLLIGHMHVLVNEKQGRTVIGAPRNNGRDLVRFELVLDADKQVIESSVDVVDMKDYEPSEELRNLIRKEHSATIAYVQGDTGNKSESGGEKLGSTTAKFQPEDEIRGIPEGKLRDTALMDLINRIQLENAQADVSASALFKDTSDLPEGDINYGNIFDIYKYDNTLYRVEVTGAELKAYMEWAATCYAQWIPGDINVSFDSDHPGYLYDMFAGVDYEIDLSQPEGSRIKNVMFRGEPLQDNMHLKLAVNNYRYSSVLKQNKLVAASREWESSCSVRDMIVRYRNLDFYNQKQSFLCHRCLSYRLH